jgi:hypothetical protein
MDQKTFTLLAGVIFIFAVVALLHLLRVLHGVASYDRQLDSADVGKLDCIRRSGWLELLRIKTPHAASLNTCKPPCSVALKISSKCLCWVSRVGVMRRRRSRIPLHLR